MERWAKRAIELGAGIFFTGKTNPSVVPFYPQKTAVSGEEQRYFHRTSPERCGVSSGRLLAMLRALEREKRANVHSLVVVKDGQVICECSHPGYKVNEFHLSHSMSKTVTGMAIGMLVDDGKLSVDTRLAEIFPEYHYSDRRVEDITVRHLLNRTTGVPFSEAGSVTETRWSEAFFSAPLSFAPGTAFNYNSMNSYMLARIVARISGNSLTAFLEQRLFAPLGITNYFWEIGPEGVEKGGWGLYLSAESWAKLGYLMLSRGVFEGKRVLSEDWIVRSTTDVIHTPDALGHFGYGYQMWVADSGEEFLFNGMLGQNVWICPKNGVVVSLNSGNNELFQNSPALAIVERYLGQELADDLTTSCFAGDHGDLVEAVEHFFESRHWVRPLQPPRGKRRKREAGYIPPEWDELLGRYHFRKNNYGMLPLIVRAMQNNLRSSLDGISLEREPDGLWLGFSECGVSYRFPVGFYEFKESVFELHGERYKVKVIGEAMEDEDRNMLFKIELLFPELPNVRRLKLSIVEDGRLLVRMSELPNHHILDRFLVEINSMNPKITFVKDMLEKRVGKHFVERMLEEKFAPALIGARIGADNYTAIMDEEREKLKASERTVKVINTVIERFIRDEADEADKLEPKGGIREFIGDVVDRFRSRTSRKRRAGIESPSAPQLPPATNEGEGGES